MADATYAAARAEIGDALMVDLTTLVGYYTLLAMTLNAFRVPVPDGGAPVLAD